MIRKCLRFIAAASGYVALSCSGGPNDPVRDDPGVYIVAGGGLTDTISASPQQGVVALVVSGDGTAEANAAVVFSAVGIPCRDLPAVTCYPLEAAPVASPNAMGPTATAVTDDQGRAVVRVRFGVIAGPATLQVTVPLYGYSATATLTVLPGNATSLSVAPRDTAIQVGQAMTLRAFPVDRAGNALTGTPTYEATSPAVTVNSSGQVAGAAMGRGYVRVRMNVNGIQRTDSAMIRVVPAGRIAISALHGPIRLSTLTGWPERILLIGNVNAQDWSPAGDRLVYVDDRGVGEYALSVTDTVGNSVQLPVPLRSTWPQYSADGSWIYFFTQNDLPPRVYRIRPDGTDLQDLMEGRFPTPAPDGITVAVTTDDGIWVGVPNTGVGAIVPSTTPDAFATRWSPNGEWIAYRASSMVRVVRPDGSGFHSYASTFIGGIAWSPDSRFILAGGDGGQLSLIDVLAGTVDLLPVTGVYPAWKR